MYKLSVNNIANIKIDYEESLKKRIPSFYRGMNLTCGGYRGGDVVVLTGRTGSGKSTLAEMEVCNLIDNSHKVACFFGEHSIKKSKMNIYKKLNGDYDCDVVYDDIMEKNKYIPKYSTIEKIDNYYNNHLMLISSKESKVTISNLIHDMYDLHKQGAEFFVIDNLLTVAPDKIIGDNILSAIASVIVEVKRFAVNTNAVVLLVAHPRKPSNGQSQSKENFISLYDVAGSADIVNWVDIVWLHHRIPREKFEDTESPFYGIHGIIDIAKNREEGILQRKPLFYDWKLNAYFDHENQHGDKGRKWKWMQNVKYSEQDVLDL